MTDFTIPEDAVEAGLRAVNTSIYCLSDREKVHVAIAAALPVMFEAVKWQYRVTTDGNVTTWMEAGDAEGMEWLKKLYADDDRSKDVQFRALLTIKESK